MLIFSLWFDPTGNRTQVYRFSSRRLGTFASGRSRLLPKKDQLFIHNFVEVKLLLAKVATGCNLSQVLNDVTFWLFRGGSLPV